MMTRFGKLVAYVLGLLILLQTAPAQVVTNKPAAQLLPLVRIALVGDSTVATQAGWENGIAACLSDRAQVTDLARNGR